MFHEGEARYPAARSKGFECDGYVWERQGAVACLLLLGFTDV